MVDRPLKLLSALFLLAVLADLPALAASQKPATSTSDFLVLGGGTAGCTVAATICRALPKATVTVLERGLPRTRREQRLSRAARNMLKAWSDPALIQRFPSAPNAGLDGRPIGVMLGSNIGGSSGINAAQITLPPTWYYGALGIAGLDAASAQRLFARIKAALRVGVAPKSLTPSYEGAWLGAARRAGLPTLATPFAGARKDRGAWPSRTAFDAAGRRFDSYEGFLKPAAAGPCAGRLRVVRGALVRRVRFDAAGRAVGAEATLNTTSGATKEAFFGAAREVLVAASAINSAAVLQRSGVGPRALLARRGVPVVRDLPVGQHVQTRAVTVLDATYSAPLAQTSNVTLLELPETTARFDAARGGPLGVSPFGPNARLPGAGYLGMRIGFDRKPPGEDGLRQVGTSCLANPARDSYGSVSIASTDPGEPPRVDLGLLNRRKDYENARRLTRLGRSVIAQLAGPMGAKEILRGGDTMQSLATEPGLEKKIRRDTWGANHYVGGCAVGRVVDDRLRVKGVVGLRVVDSGAIRQIPPNAGPLASVYIVALRAAEIIVEDNADLNGGM